MSLQCAVRLVPSRLATSVPDSPATSRSRRCGPRSQPASRKRDQASKDSWPAKGEHGKRAKTRTCMLRDSELSAQRSASAGSWRRCARWTVYHLRGHAFRQGTSAHVRVLRDAFLQCRDLLQRLCNGQFDTDPPRPQGRDELVRVRLRNCPALCHADVVSSARLANVSFLFQRQGYAVVSGAADAEEQLTNLAIDYDAEDVSPVPKDEGEPSSETEWKV